MKLKSISFNNYITFLFYNLNELIKLDYRNNYIIFYRYGIYKRFTWFRNEVFWFLNISVDLNIRQYFNLYCVVLNFNYFPSRISHTIYYIGTSYLYGYLNIWKHIAKILFFKFEYSRTDLNFSLKFKIFVTYFNLPGFQVV